MANRPDQRGPPHPAEVGRLATRTAALSAGMASLHQAPGESKPQLLLLWLPP